MFRPFSQRSLVNIMGIMLPCPYPIQNEPLTGRGRALQTRVTFANSSPKSYKAKSGWYGQNSPRGLDR